jgi:5-methylcytosine-specific restriction endonuclease McrA
MDKEKLKEQYYNTARSLWMMTQEGGLVSFDRYYERYQKQCSFIKYCEMKERESATDSLKKYYKNSYEQPKIHIGNRMVVTEYIVKRNEYKYKDRTLFLCNRPLVLKRDKYKCTECGSMTNLEVHHIKARSKGGSDEMNNLTTLCLMCHAKKHKGEAIHNLMIKKISYKNELYH